MQADYKCKFLVYKGYPFTSLLLNENENENITSNVFFYALFFSVEGAG